MKRGMSSAGSHDPRYEPRSVRSSATRLTAGISSIRCGCGRPTVTVVPPRRVAAYACASTCALPTVSIALSAPPAVAARTDSAAASSASTVSVAPSPLASASLSGTTSTATIAAAPARRAPSSAASPTPPSPKIATVSPGSTRAALIAAPAPVAACGTRGRRRRPGRRRARRGRPARSRPCRGRSRRPPPPPRARAPSASRAGATRRSPTGPSGTGPRRRRGRAARRGRAGRARARRSRAGATRRRAPAGPSRAGRRRARSPHALGDHEPFERGAQPRRDVDGPAARAIAEHVHEPTGRGELVAAGDRELVANARPPQAPDPQVDVDRLRERDRRLVLAVRLGAHADHVSVGDVEAAFADEPFVDRGVEERVVLDVIDVAVDVVVLPTRLERERVRVVQQNWEL